MRRGFWKQFAVLLGGLAFASSASATEPVYTIADLHALEARKSYEELLAHIEDIAPSARGSEWDALLVTAAKGYIGQLSTSSAAYDAFWSTEALVQRYAALRNSPDLMALRSDVGKAAIERCFDRSYTGQECLDRARDFIRVAPLDRGLDAAVGKIVRLHQNHYVAVPFFRAAVVGVPASPVCADGDLKLAVMAGLGLPPDDDLARQAREVAVTCFDALKSDIRAATFAASTYTRANASAVVKAKGGAT